jgi:DNA-3-methyladenine glycosylase II
VPDEAVRGGADPGPRPGASGPVPSLRFTLAAVPPVRLDLTAWALRRRPSNAVDRWDGQVYRRVLVLDGIPVEATVWQAAAPDAGELAVSVLSSDASPGVIGADRGLQAGLSSLLSGMLGLGVDLSAFYRIAAAHPVVGALAERFQGVKPPRFPSVFESLVNGVACQQASLGLGIVLLNRLAELCGPSLALPGGVVHGFPAPGDVAALDHGALRSLGFSGQKARALLEIAATGEDLEGLRWVEDRTTVSRRLRALRGVGRWTAEYVLLRGLGRIDVFPGDDVGARNNLRKQLGLPDDLDYDAARKVVSTFDPYAGMVYFHLLLGALAERSLLASE